MAELQCEPDSPSRLQPVFDLLAWAGYEDAHKPHDSTSDKLAGGLAWCLATLNPSEPKRDVVYFQTLNPDHQMHNIEEALRSIKCPYPLEAFQIRNPESEIESVIPVVQWLRDRVRTFREDRKDEVLNQLQLIRERIAKEDAETKVQMLVSHLRSLKDLEKQELEFQSSSNAIHSKLQTEINELKEKIASGCDSTSLWDGLNNPLSDSAEQLNSARKELAVKLRAILAVKRKLDDVPSQSELVQYERRFSELYAHIQGKHQQTQKYYDTYNALLEIKELMLKETSLLNSISSQFQVAITSTDGRMKLIDSMEGIAKGSQQKLDKVRFGVQEQQKVCDALKERYAEAIAAQRHWYSLLKAFQDECAKNERLRGLSSG
ncbi:hypothetical protein UlMin_035460 [Ulmus minor]